MAEYTALVLLAFLGAALVVLVALTVLVTLISAEVERLIRLRRRKEDGP